MSVCQCLQNICTYKFKATGETRRVLDEISGDFFFRNSFDGTKWQYKIYSQLFEVI